MSEKLVFPWEREAMRGSPLPDGFPLHDQMAYLSLRAIYHDFHGKRLGREAAAAEKHKIFAVWDKAKRTAEFDQQLAFFQARLHKDVERAAAAVRKNPSSENAIMLCDVLDGLKEYRPEVDGGDSA